MAPHIATSLVASHVLSLVTGPDWNCAKHLTIKDLPIF
ncbi:hypothetical protein IMCC9480_3238 [Oxalobacteraceae bacterium IMCC9480]|nr:hypothetical protein IMCC9480_3238 [Oxalobacteraceae bacterium IMCC9480]